MAKHKKHTKKNPKGTKKGDTIHGQKKGKKGEAAAYITRAQALAKLSLPLADFRKLCILKGIYPRDPKKKSHGLDKTYYHVKDISFLTHEPLLNKFFELKTFMKKFKRLIGRNENSLASSLETRKPAYTLHHLVRERYPSLDDAVRDLDDAVSMLALFQSLSADQRKEIPTDAINEATRLYQEFQLYVIRAQALRKVFVSIKGYYFQAEISGHLVTWLAPHQFAQNLPGEVDFRVMLTFLEFYRTLVKFVNFKLYSDLGMAYPPKRQQKQDEHSAEVAALVAEMKEAAQAQEPVSADVTSDVVADFGEQSAEVLEMQRQAVATNRMKIVFRGLRVYINREIPLRPVYFVLLCGGVTSAGWERGSSTPGGSGSGSAFKASDTRITHQIVDRPVDQLDVTASREYVQPQWVFDSFNTGCLLPVGPYGAGRVPPPHLSPFIDDKAEGYIPRQRQVLDSYAAEVAGEASKATQSTDAATSSASADGNPPNGGSAVSQGTFQQFSQELQAEASGTWHSSFREQQKKHASEQMEKAFKTSDAVVLGDEKEKQEEAEQELMKPAPRPTEEEEERLRAKALMPKKHKRLLQRIESSAQKKLDANTRLAKKRKQLDERKAEA